MPTSSTVAVDEHLLTLCLCHQRTESCPSQFCRLMSARHRVTRYVTQRPCLCPSQPKLTFSKGIPGSYPQAEELENKPRRRPKRKSTVLTIDSAAEPDLGVGGRDMPFTNSPLSEKAPESGSPLQPMYKVASRARKSAHQVFLSGLNDSLPCS